MSIQITKQDNFIKINIMEDVHWTDYAYYLKNFDESLYPKIYMRTIDYDCKEGTELIPSKIIYFFEANNSYYTISSNKGMTFINKRTIYNEKNPNTKDFGTPEDEISDFDKSFHIDDKSILVCLQLNTYALQNIKHGLYHGSTFYGAAFNSKNCFDYSSLNKPILLKMVHELIAEIKDIENIETVLDLRVLGIIPKPDSKKLVNTKN